MVNTKEIIKNMESSNLSFICNIEIDFKDFKEIFPNDEVCIKDNNFEILKESLELYPLYGGGLGEDGRFDIIVVFKNDNIKLERVYRDFEVKFKLKKRLE